MFKTVISDAVYHSIISKEEEKVATNRSFLYKSADCLVGTILVGNKFYVVDTTSKFERKGSM